VVRISGRLRPSISVHPSSPSIVRGSTIPFGHVFFFVVDLLCRDESCFFVCLTKFSYVVRVVRLVSPVLLGMAPVLSFFFWLNKKRAGGFCAFVLHEYSVRWAFDLPFFFSLAKSKKEGGAEYGCGRRFGVAKQRKTNRRGKKSEWKKKTTWHASARKEEIMQWESKVEREKNVGMGKKVAWKKRKKEEKEKRRQTRAKKKKEAVPRWKTEIAGWLLGWIRKTFRSMYVASLRGKAESKRSIYCRSLFSFCCSFFLSLFFPRSKNRSIPPRLGGSFLFFLLVQKRERERERTRKWM